MLPSSESRATESVSVGIIMPCYNMGEYIEDAIASLKKQTFKDFKVIIADDASTDMKTRKKLEAIDLPINMSLVLEKKNLGLSGIRNKYMKKFDTKYIFSFDPDDILEPRFLEKCINYMESHPDKAAVATWLNRFGTESGISRLSEESATLPGMLITNNYLGSCILRKEVFTQVGGYDTSDIVYGAEDYDFWLSALEKGWSLGVIPEALFRYRRLANSSSSQSAKPEKSIRWRRYIIQKHLSLYKKYFIDVLIGFEKRSSDAHVGYLYTSEQLRVLSDEYKILHTYVEEDLLPEVRRYRNIAHRLRFINPKKYFKKVQGVIDKKKL